jgi:hypothetical protein
MSTPTPRYHCLGRVKCRSDAAALAVRKRVVRDLHLPEIVGLLFIAAKANPNLTFDALCRPKGTPTVGPHGFRHLAKNIFDGREKILTDRASPHVAFAITHTLPVENASCNGTLFTVYQTDQALVVRLGAPRFRGAFVLPGRDEQRPITRAARPGGVAESFFQHATPIMLLDSRQVFDQ